MKALGFTEKQADYAVYSVSFALGLCPDAPDPIDITAGQQDPFEESAEDSGEPEWQMVGPDDAHPKDEKESTEQDSDPEQAAPDAPSPEAESPRDEPPAPLADATAEPAPMETVRRVRSQMSLLLTAPETPRRGTLKRCLSRPLRQNQQSAPESLVITLRQSHLPEMLPLRQSHLPPATRALSFTRGVRCTATGAGRGRTTPRR